MVAILAGLLVSIDALFIGVSFGTQKRCKVWHVLIINAVLFALCFAGFGLGVLIGERIDFELDILIGVLFISLGAWVAASYFLLEKRKKQTEGSLSGYDEDNKPSASACENSFDDNGNETECSASKGGAAAKSKKEKRLDKSIALTGLFMSVEAMFITVGLVLTLDVTTVLIPLTVALAHLVYSVVTFFFAKYLRRLPPVAGPVIAGIALIIYGVMAIVI